MVKFSVPVRGETPAFRFSVHERGVLFAGSRHQTVPQAVCRALVQGLGDCGFRFWVGCAPGVDRSFRKTLSASPYRKRVFVGCAFPERACPSTSCGLFASVVVPRGLSPAAALRRRTLWLVKRSCLVVLFPEVPHTTQWGAGSRLVYRTALEQLKPVFAACSVPPASSPDFRVLRSELFGVSGYWVVPHPVEEGGSCDDEF